MAKNETTPGNTNRKRRIGLPAQPGMDGFPLSNGVLVEYEKYRTRFN